MEQHLQYFKKNILEEIHNGIEMKAYDFMYNINREYLGDVAMSYFGSKISYKELFENIEACASSLIALDRKW